MSHSKHDRPHGSSRQYSLRYFGLRTWLLRHPFLYCLTFSFRALLALGPWRDALIRAYQKRNKEGLNAVASTLFRFNPEETVRSINEKGFSFGIELDDEHLSNILDFCKARSRDQLRPLSFPHEECEIIFRIAHDPKVIETARRYLGCEPILWLTELFWNTPALDEKDYSRFPAFHYDLHDLKSLNVFIYLTDVDLDSAPHAIIEGTHKDRSFSKITHPYISDDKATRTYGGKIKVITARKGTGFFEDTLCYHKASDCKKARLVLHIIYTLSRRRRYAEAVNDIETPRAK